MKKIPCAYQGCSNRRIHHERQDEMRPHRMVEVADDFPADKKVYCSIECACYDGVYDVKTGWIKKEDK